MRPRTGALAADEVAVRGRDRPGAGRHALAVGGDAHRAPGLAPAEAGFTEQLVETFGLRFALYSFRARHNPGRHTFCDLPAACDAGRLAQIREAAVRTGAY